MAFYEAAARCAVGGALPNESKSNEDSGGERGPISVQSFSGGRRFLNPHPSRFRVANKFLATVRE